MTYEGDCSFYNYLLHYFSIFPSLCSIGFPFIPSTTSYNFLHGRDNSIYSSYHTQKKPKINTTTTNFDNKINPLPSFPYHAYPYNNPNFLYKEDNKGAFMNMRWTNEEDSMLRTFVLKPPKRPVSWSNISKKMGRRKNANQCRYRWCNNLQPHIKTGDWDEEEDKLLVKYHKIYKNQWTKIAQHIRTRTNVSIRNHFYSTERKLSKIKWKVEPPSVLNNYIRSRRMYRRNTTTFTPTSNTVIVSSASPSSLVFGDVAESSNARRFQSESSPSNLVSLGNEKEDEEMFLNNVCQYVDQMKDVFEWMD